MNHTRKLLSTLSISGVLLALTPGAALAVDASDVESRLKALFERQGVTASWSSIDGDASRLSLAGVAVTAPGQPAPAVIGDIAMENITEDGDVLVIGSMSMPAYTMAVEGMSFAMNGVAVSGLRLPPADGSGDPIDTMGFYEQAGVESMSVSMGGNSVFSLEKLAMAMERGDDDVSFTGVAQRFTADLGAIDDAQTQATTQALGYETISGRFDLAGTWSPGDGRVTLQRNDISIDDAGTLGFTFDISGYTADFVQALRQVQARMAEASEEEQAMQGMAMLGLMQQLNLHGARLRFDDDTLTRKVLAFLAVQQGVQPGDIANQAKAVLPFAMAQLNNPQLTTEVSAAVNTFLDNPEALEISIEPERPIPFALVAAGAMTAPQALPQQLGLRVRANR